MRVSTGYSAVQGHRLTCLWERIHKNRLGSALCTCASQPHLLFSANNSTNNRDDRLVLGTINSFYGVFVPRASQCLGVIF